VVTTPSRRDRTGELVEEDDRTEAERAAYGAWLVSSALATRKARDHKDDSGVLGEASNARAPVVGPVTKEPRTRA
jgi:hypothetical protein